jgi:hypothetical protein
LYFDTFHAIPTIHPQYMAKVPLNEVLAQLERWVLEFMPPPAAGRTQLYEPNQTTDLSRPDTNPSQNLQHFY